jgi:mRNA-degrading endonuclease RelE of RelBE toxin-antitoxin system
MAVLALHPDAKADLDSMIPSDASLIAVILQELESDPGLAANLTDDGFDENAQGAYGVKKWTRLWNAGLDIWRLRLWKAEWLGLNYRIFYAYLRTQQRFYILAIVPRDQVDYDDPNHHLALRIRAAYDEL